MDKGNLWIYEQVREVPKGAQRAIQGGRLRGKTDINPMWRLKALTEMFGPVGTGWKYTIDKMWTEAVGDVVAVFVNISLYYKHNGEWSEAIPGTGGNMLAEKEKSGIYVSDECYKMALTDAIGVAAKALGVAANIYWESDKTKYNNDNAGQAPKAVENSEPKSLSNAQEIAALIKDTKITGNDIAAKVKADFGKDKVNELTESEFALFFEQIERCVSESENNRR